MLKKFIFILAALLLLELPAYADAPFRSHRYSAVDIMPVHPGDIVFVGNSITNMHEWWEAFGCRQNIVNRGVSGCKSDETLKHIGAITAGRPSKVFLMVGTNDIGEGVELNKIVKNVEAIATAFKTDSPETELYIQSILPVAKGDKRPADSIIQLNSLYKSLCEREGLTYIDLWSLLVEPGTTHINPAYTKDGLHLYPSGYRVWCNAISEYVGAGCIYEDRPFNDCGLAGSFGMRAAAFDMLPLDEDDIVLIGDEMIHGGEWHELLGSARVKSRGSCWGFGGPSIEVIEREIPAIFRSGKSPAQIYLHAGAAEIAGNIPVDTLEAAYRRLVKTIKAAAPESRIFLMTPQPVYPGHGKITDQIEVNARIFRIAKEEGASFVDIYTPLTAADRTDRRFLKGNYVFGKGYLRIREILARSMEIDIERVICTSRETAFTGRGNRNETLTTLTVSSGKRERLKKMIVRLDADASDVETIKVICGDNVLGSTKVKKGKSTYKIRCRCSITETTGIRVCADIAGDAAEGGKVCADIVKARFGLRWHTLRTSAPGHREILLKRVKVLGAGDYGSAGYRIPAIITLPDGTLLITSDKRKNNDLDLPEDIDIIAQRSTDGGRSWSDPVTVAEGRGFNKGYGDAALVTTASGDVLCAFSGGTGVWPSTLEAPQRNYICRSTDGGLTWSEPFDCTRQLWGPTAENHECRTYHSAFFASGRGLRLEHGKYAGRVMFVAAVHSNKLGRFDNYVYYSDDEGRSWKVSKSAFLGGDEAKVVELPDGRVLLSVRRHGERGFNISEDGGATWGEQGTWPEICVNACDGDILNLGDSILLHSVPNSMQRENVSLFASRDNGRTWPYVKSICPYESVYSSMTLLQDGTIGVYFEENPYVEFDMYYVNFSPGWLLNN